jgi:hypothetical protein
MLEDAAREAGVDVEEIKRRSQTETEEIAKRLQRTGRMIAPAAPMMLLRRPKFKFLRFQMTVNTIRNTPSLMPTKFGVFWWQKDSARKDKPAPMSNHTTETRVEKGGSRRDVSNRHQAST